MPVGRVEYHYLTPMTFKEFLAAKSEEKIISKIESYELGDNLTNSFHEKSLSLVKEYLAIGGMPEAVKTFSIDNSSTKNIRIHKSILDNYKSDFSKYANKGDLFYLQKLLEVLPGSIGRKIKYVDLIQDELSRDIKKWLHLLIQARVIGAVYHSNCSSLPLSSTQNEKVFKIFFLDVGLLHTIQGLGFNELTKATSESISSFGTSHEQFVFQNLQPFLNNEINEMNYWLREGKSTNAEVDFVISNKGKIISIEVKSGSTGSLRSLHQFMHEKNKSLAIRINSELPSKTKLEIKLAQQDKTTTVKYDLISLPLYLVSEIPRLLSLTI